MLLAVLRYLRGYLRIRITGCSPERFLNLCRHHQIILWNLAPGSHSYEMNINCSNFKKLKPILKKTNSKIFILKRYGFCFFLHKYRKRKMFFIGFFLCISIIYTLSQFIWNIEINGNSKRTDEAVIQYLKTIDIYHGMKKSKIKCEKIVKNIRKEYNDIIWVSVSLNGTQLIIDIKENTDTFLASEEKNVTPVDIFSDSEGIITKIITRKGVPQVHAGDTIHPKQLLISGKIPVENDDKEVVGYQYVKSDADIYAKKMMHYENKITFVYPEKEYSGIEKKEYFVILGDFSFCIGSHKHHYKDYMYITEQIPICLGKQFELPISVGYTNIRHYKFIHKTYTEQEIKKRLNVEFQKYCNDLKKKKVEIIQNNVKIHIEQQYLTASGTLEVIEPIGVATPFSMIP